MVKRLVPIVAALMLMSSVQLYALSLGELTLESGANQPLNARIILLDTAGLSASDISVQLASAADFERFGLDRHPALANLEFTVELDGATGPVLRVRSPVSINEPFVSLVLDTRWPSGRVLTEYTLRFEAPAFSAQSSAPATVTPVRSVFEPLAADSIAQPAAAVSSAAATTAAITTQPGTTASAGTTGTAAPVSAAFANASTITVNAGDTLWEIALRVRPDSSVSVQQTMLALQRLNPGAFINNNINQVRRGEVLRVPELSEIRQLSNAEAVAEVSRQNQALTRSPATTTPAQPVTAAPTPVTSPSAQGELRVVTVDDPTDQRPDASAAGDQTAQTSQRLRAVEDRLATRLEDLDRLDATNEELNARLSMLQQQIASAQEIIRLRDLELAQLQQSLAEQEAPATTPAPPVITMAPDAGPVERFMNAIVSNTWALLGTSLALILLLVLVLVRRNKAARELEQNDQRSNDDMPLGEDSDEILFSGVAAAAAEAAEERGEGLERDDTAEGLHIVVDDSDDDLERDDREAFASTDDDPDAGYGTAYETEPEEETSNVGDARYDIADPDTIEPDWGETEFDEDVDADELDTLPSEQADTDSMAEQKETDNFEDDFAWVDDDKEEQGPADTFDKSEFDISDTDDLQTAEPETSDELEDDFDDLAFISTDESLNDDVEDEDDEDFAFLSDSDEAATKLDLARAYIDMGDVDGAREILNEVLQEGTEVQRQDAEALLNRL